MKRFSHFLCLIAVFVTVFAFSCIPSFAAETLTYIPEWEQTSYYYSIDSIVPVQVGGNGTISFNNSASSTHYNGTYNEIYKNNDYYVFWHGSSYAYSTNKLQGGYSYSGYLAIEYSAIFDSIFGTSSHFNSHTDYVSVTDPVLVFDNSTLPNCNNVRSSDTGGKTWFIFKDLYVNGTDRMLFRFDFKGYTLVRAGLSSGGYPLEDFNIKVTTDVKTYRPQDYSITGTTAGFKDNLTDFDNAMNEGSKKENVLSDKAISDVNSFEFKDINDDSSILSSLTFYSSVITLAYGSLGGTIQTLLTISFGLLIVIFILRIRRDSS